MKRLLLLLFATLFIAALGSAAWYFVNPDKGNERLPKVHVAEAKNRLKHTLKKQAAALLPYAARNNYNTGVCFLIDMQINSGSNRFFIYDLKKDSVLDAGLVTHGRCNKLWLDGRQYDNKIGCGCTSLGKYRIGKPYQGRFGLAYKLHGLDSTNSNAFKRYVVLHAHDCVPDAAVAPASICQSDGCPTVSPAFLKKLAHLIDASSKPILLCILDDQ